MALTKYLSVALLVLVLNPVIAQDTSQHKVPNRTNSVVQDAKPYVILISADGFRYDVATKYNCVNLLRLSEAGVAAAYMQPSFPSLTFPNHYTLVTGLYPAHHGLVDNYFYDAQRKEVYGMSNKNLVADSSWYGGTPLWVLAEQQQMLSASFYWVASESAIQGVRPSYYYIYNQKIDIDTRIRAVKDWLQLPEEKRPHLVTFYFPEMDHAEHKFGPDSKEAAEAAHFIDESIGKMVAATDSLHLAVNYIFVADHGMTEVDNKHPMPLPAAIDTNKFIIPTGDALVQLYAKNKKDILPTYKKLKKTAVGFNVYLPSNAPERWHYSRKDDTFKRIGDIIIVPIPPNIFSIRGRATDIGKHGFDPSINEMHASFYAWGPAFKQHMKIDGFENVHIYPLVAAILGLPYSFTIDGKLRVLKPVLKE